MKAGFDVGKDDFLHYYTPPYAVQTIQKDFIFRNVQAAL